MNADRRRLNDSVIKAQPLTIQCPCCALMNRMRILSQSVFICVYLRFHLNLSGLVVFSLVLVLDSASRLVAAAVQPADYRSPAFAKASAFALTPPWGQPLD